DITAGRPQPGAVEIPIDLQYAMASVTVPTVRAPRPIVPDPAAIASAVDVLKGASRPLIWAGGGVVAGGGSASLVTLAEKIDAPVLTTVTGRGSIPEDHPLCLGAFTAHPAVGAVIAE